MALRSILSSLSTKLHATTTTTTAIASSSPFIRRFCTTDNDGEQLIDPVYFHLKEGENNFFGFNFKDKVLYVWADLPGISQQGFQIKIHEDIFGKKVIKFTGDEMCKYKADRQDTPTRKYSGLVVLDPDYFEVEKVNGCLVDGRVSMTVPVKTKKLKEEGGALLKISQQDGCFRIEK